MHDKYARVRLLALGLALTSAAAAATGVRTGAGPLSPDRVSRGPMSPPFCGAGTAMRPRWCGTWANSDRTCAS